LNIAISLKELKSIYVKRCNIAWNEVESDITSFRKGGGALAPSLFGIDVC
jgi:hypothetical protein